MLSLVCSVKIVDVLYMYLCTLYLSYYKVTNYQQYFNEYTQLCYCHNTNDLLPKSTFITTPKNKLNCSSSFCCNIIMLDYF